VRLLKLFGGIDGVDFSCAGDAKYPGSEGVTEQGWLRAFVGCTWFSIVRLKLLCCLQLAYCSHWL